MAGLGAAAAGLYGTWALLLLFGCLGPHLVIVGLTLRGWWRLPRSRWFLVPELVYGLVNPVVYLLVFQPALFRRWTPAWLPSLCWLAWAAYWGARVFGNSLAPRAVSQRQWVRRLLQFTVTVLAAIALRDVLATITGTDVLGARLSVLMSGLFCLPLYALPLMTALRQLSTTRSDESWATNDFFLGRLPGWVLATVCALAGLAIVATLPRTSEEEVRALLVRNRDTIIAVSRERNLDPRLLASIIEVTQRDLASPFQSSVEDLVTDVWLTDARSHMLLAEALDPSLGLSQVKAHTVLTAYAIVELSDPAAPRWLVKDYRSVRALDREVLERVPAPSLRRVPTPTRDRLPEKHEVVAALKTPAGNLANAAFLLDLIAAQWEGANPTWSIRARPEILATLFQLGFRHSVPKPDPRANDFGARVQEAFTDPWMASTFAPVTRL